VQAALPRSHLELVCHLLRVRGPGHFTRRTHYRGGNSAHPFTRICNHGSGNTARNRGQRGPRCARARHRARMVARGGATGRPQGRPCASAERRARAEAIRYFGARSKTKATARLITAGRDVHLPLRPAETASGDDRPACARIQPYSCVIYRPAATVHLALRLHMDQQPANEITDTESSDRCE